MELRHLRYFVAVAEELSFRRAAARLHIAPPPLSIQIRQLEEEVGADLLSRTGRGLCLTEAGRVFLEQARQTLVQASRAVSLARQTAQGATGGHLAIGYNAVAESGVLPAIVRAFRERWPKVELTLRALRTPNQFEALSRGELDLGFLCPPPPTDAFDLQDLTKQPFVVGLSSDHPLAAAPAVSFADLSGEPLVLYSRELDPDSFRQIEEHFRCANAVMHVAYELESSHSMINFVAAGNGCCIVPEYVRGFRPGEVVCKPLGPSDIVRTLAIAKTKGREGLVESFYGFAVDAFRGADATT